MSCVIFIFNSIDTSSYLDDINTLSEKLQKKFAVHKKTNHKVIDTVNNR